jgi:hypothetical protein
MMRVAALTFLLSTTTATAARSAGKTYTPVRISYADLAQIHNEENVWSTSSATKALVQALEDVGMISVTDIPSFRDCKMKTLNAFQDCVVDSTAAKEHTFPDGTVRRTIASHCVAGKAHKIRHDVNDPKKSAAAAAAACVAFDEASETFRQVVADVTETFAMSLNAALNVTSDKTLLVSESRSFSLVVSCF